MLDFAQENATELVSGFQEIVSKETTSPAPKKTNTKKVKNKRSFFFQNKLNPIEKEKSETFSFLQER